jgi:acetyl-CoA C-acetyltransferase
MPKPKTPVLVGVAQVLQRTDDLDAAKEPLELMVDATRLAAEDAGSSELLSRAGSVRVIRGIWKYQDPARFIAQSIGCPGAQTAITPFGGNFVQTTVNRSCLDIQSGEQDIVIITSMDCKYCLCLQKIFKIYFFI